MRSLSLYIAKRLLLIPLSLAVLATASFLLVTQIPGDPGVTILGQFATPSEIARIDHELGVDQPIPIRYLNYMSQLLHGDLGTSFYTGQPVGRELISYLPNTIELIVPSLLLAALLGLTMGGIAAYYRRAWPDWLARSIITVTQSVPDFVLGLILIYVIFFVLRLAPAPTGLLAATDVSPPSVTHFLLIDSLLNGDASLFLEAVGHMVLPVVTLGIVYSAFFAKTVRSCMGEAMHSAQVEFARACGLPERQVIRYALLESRTPILTYGAILFGSLLGGESIVERVFAWPGIGQWALQSMLTVDVPVIQAFILVAGLATLLIYLVLDVTVAALDPRVVRE